jgi:lipopolysaccharide/colanic/teichoic acid biosynthesis glycosyltransferase
VATFHYYRRCYQARDAGPSIFSPRTRWPRREVIPHPKIPFHGGDAPQIGRVITIRSDSRITRVGSFIRKIKLDEFPQLINVLTGHMSLVGPRPEVPELMTLYTREQQALILSFRPGMTDYASILFRHESYLLDGRDDPVEVYRREIMPIKFSYYERYTRDVGFINDVRIICATVVLLIIRHVPKIFGIEHALPFTKPE